VDKQGIKENEMAMDCKKVDDVTINYEDRTHDKVPFYALVGYDGETWFSLMCSPPKMESKIKMNNALVGLSDYLLESINK
jgi:hypothetical protein